MLVQLEEGRHVNDVLLQQAQLLLEDIPVPVDAALQGMEQSRKGPKFLYPLPWGGVCATLGWSLAEMGAVTRSVGDYLHVLVLLRQDLIGEHLVDGDALCVYPPVP